MPTADTFTVPPPTAAAALMAFWIADALLEMPSPSAPKVVISKFVAGMLGSGGSASAETPTTTESNAIRRAVTRYIALLGHQRPRRMECPRKITLDPANILPHERDPLQETRAQKYMPGHGHREEG